MATLPTMVSVFDSNDNFVERINEFPNAKCSVCNKPASAMWRGATDLFICQECAVNILPRLMADAIVQPHTKMHQITDMCKTAEVAFWQAVAVKGR
jgi:ribosomal protein L37AE/L43A